MAQSEKIYVSYYDETYISISSQDIGVLEELSEYFTFFAPNYQFSPKYKFGMWDGKIRLFNRINNTIYRGLLRDVVRFCLERKYPIDISQDVKVPNIPFDIQNFIKFLDIKNITPYAYQTIAIEKMIRERRLLLESPTGSGKSFIMYAVLRYILENTNEKILLLVPSISLVLQLTKEFKEYSDYDIESHIHQIYEGKEKFSSEKRLFISTWQSVESMDKKYFEQFGCIMGDEAHGITAKTCKGIFESCTNAKFRYGLTGTVKDCQTHILVLTGLTGNIHTTTTNKEMQETGRSSVLDITALLLQYDDDIRKQNSKYSYRDEIEFIVGYKKRTKFISELALGCGKTENVLILTAFIEHAESIANYISSTGKKVILVCGKVKGAERERIREYCEQNNGVIIVATYGVYSQGVNIKNLQHLIFATPYKSKVKVLQSIGRLLRLDGKKNMAFLYDIIDDFSYKGKNNTILNQFFERWAIYSKEKFNKRIKKISL